MIINVKILAFCENFMSTEKIGMVLMRTNSRFLWRNLQNYPYIITTVLLPVLCESLFQHVPLVMSCQL